jgi:GNAT superfamily N-acetyltransferase
VGAEDVAIEQVTLAAVDDLAAALAEAFDGYEWTAHTIAADDHHRRVRRSFAAYLRYLLVPAGHAWMTADRRAGAMWTPPDPPPPDPEVHAQLLAAVEEAVGDRWEANERAEAALDERRPSGPVWVLESLGTAPDVRRTGHATALLEDGLARVDADRADAYLETCGEANVSFYLRFGFRSIGETELEGGPTVVHMVRPAGGAA